jgi:hypothetical protein
MGRNVAPRLTTPADGRDVVLVAMLVDPADLRDLDDLEGAVETVVLRAVDDSSAPIARDPHASNGLTVDPRVLERLATRAREQAAELDRLRTVQARTATVERAKGILMARHGITEQKASEMLRRHARSTNSRIVDVADAVLASYSLFVDAREIGLTTP